MRTFAFAFVAAATLLAAPTFTVPAAADPGVELRAGPGGVGVRVGEDRDMRRDRDRPGYRAYGWRDRDRDRCSTTVVIRDGRRTVIKRCRD